MKLLLDANLSPVVAAALTKAGYETAHVEDVGLLTAEDPTIFDHAAAEGYVVVTSDTDFPMLLALRQTTSPSVVLLRHVAELPPDAQIDLLLANLPSVAEDLEKGVIVSMSPTRLAVRDLPVGRRPS